MNYSYAYPHPAVTTDIVIFSVRDAVLNALLIRRKSAPYKGRWALPGGFVRIDESVDACAVRELEEETGIRDVYLEQLYTFGEPKRDPRERVISVAYFALAPSQGLSLQAGTDAADVAWYAVDELPNLAFDHLEIIETARARLRAKLEYSTVGLKLMPDEFTLSEAMTLYEIISGQARDKRNFRKWLLSLDVIEETGNKKVAGAHRPAMLYRLKDADDIRIIR
jgi:8-oxo-dGTP diphosphatase